MSQGEFMQLWILLLLALMGGNASALKEVKPILESLGGGEALDALNKAEELSGMISAVQAMTGNGNKGGRGQATRASSSHGCNGGKGGESCGEFAQHGFPLAPIANIADENITYCLSRYIALGE